MIEAYLGAAVMSALTVSSGVSASRYGAVAVLHDVSLEVRPGEIVCVIGANGAGKTTLLKTIAGVLRPAAGRVVADGRDIGGRPSWWVARHGIALVPEGRGVFGDQSVRDNLHARQPSRARAGATPRRSARTSRARSPSSPPSPRSSSFPPARCPAASSRCWRWRAGSWRRPRVLLLDEPSLGLAPILVREIFAAIERLRTQGVTVLLVEQMAAQALALADRAYVLERGRITLEGPAAEVRSNPAVIDAYLGRGANPGAP